jgi:hypothetical protein
MESNGSSSSAGLDQLSKGGQSPQRMPWLFTGLRPYLIIYIIMAVFLASFYLILIVLWSTQVFDHRFFDIRRLGQVDLFVSVLSQAWIVGTISVIAFTVQAIASQLAIWQCLSNFFYTYLSVLTHLI